MFHKNIKRSSKVMSKIKLNIRRGTVEDAEMLAPLAVKIFSDTFADNPLNKPDDMRAYITKFLRAEAFAKDLADENSIFFIAETEKK